MSNLAIDLWAEERENWKPPEELTVSQWAERHRVLTKSEIKGKLRFSLTPYMQPILDQCLDPDVEQIVVCKAAQIAGTEGMTSVIGYYSHQQPCPIMIVLAD